MEAEEQQVIKRKIRQPLWTLDRGTGYYQQERVKHKKASLLETGRHAGRSRVRIEGLDYSTILRHLLKRDFFTTAVETGFLNIVSIYMCVYSSTILGWACLYWASWRAYPHCFIGFYSFKSAFLFSIETQQTIGFGVRAPGDCWLPAFLVGLHSIFALLLDSVILGIVFTRISHPKQRGRTLLISDCAVIARRDGTLKLMVRVGDMKQRQVINPKALGAEIVVVFEGNTELGHTFMCRQSYLPSELHWGHTFVNIIHRAKEGETQHVVDISRFHEVEPQAGLDTLPPNKLSRKVVGGGANTVPGQVLHENTFVLSDDAVVATRDGKPLLMFRVGDTMPGQMVGVAVRAFIFRWNVGVTAEGETIPYDVQELELTPSSLILRYPLVVTHEIREGSPIAGWSSQQGMRQDADAEIMLEMRGTMYVKSRTVTKSKVYGVLGDVKWGYHFMPVVQPTSLASTRLTANVNWDAFHAITPALMISTPPGPPQNPSTSGPRGPPPTHGAPPTHSQRRPAAPTASSTAAATTPANSSRPGSPPPPNASLSSTHTSTTNSPENSLSRPSADDYRAELEQPVASRRPLLTPPHPTPHPSSQPPPASTSGAPPPTSSSTGHHHPQQSAAGATSGGGGGSGGAGGGGSSSSSSATQPRADARPPGDGSAFDHRGDVSIHGRIGDQTRTPGDQSQPAATAAAGPPSAATAATATVTPRATSAFAAASTFSSASPSRLPSPRARPTQGSGVDERSLLPEGVAPGLGTAFGSFHDSFGSEQMRAQFMDRLSRDPSIGQEVTQTLGQSLGLQPQQAEQFMRQQHQLQQQERQQQQREGRSSQDRQRGNNLQQQQQQHGRRSSFDRQQGSLQQPQAQQQHQLQHQQLQQQQHQHQQQQQPAMVRRNSSTIPRAASPSLMSHASSLDLTRHVSDATRAPQHSAAPPSATSTPFTSPHDTNHAHPAAAAPRRRPTIARRRSTSRQRLPEPTTRT
ncbi:MAG: hypothetical protein WDW38_008842 [Sanguina aurantia]